jgi:hypothetical protein
MMKVVSATPGYLPALGAEWIRGRDFEEPDGASIGGGVILSESAARLYFPGEDPVGRAISPLPAMFGMAGQPRVIGVVRDIKYDGLDSPASTAIYLPWKRRPLGSGYLVVRSGQDVMRLAPDVRRAAREIDPTAPISELQLVDHAIADTIANRRTRALPAVSFGLLAVTVAFIGVVATLSTLIGERRRDLAIRSALGASPRQLSRTILGPGLQFTALGLLIGLGLSIAVARTLGSLLYRVSPYDRMTFAGTAILVGGGAVMISCLAAFRARRIDTIIVLRSE